MILFIYRMTILTFLFGISVNVIQDDAGMLTLFALYLVGIIVSIILSVENK